MFTRKSNKVKRDRLIEEMFPSFTVADQGKALSVADDGTLEFSLGDHLEFEALKAEYELVKALVKATVSFDTDEGSSVASQSVPFGDTATEPEDPTKEGFVFAGWFTEDTFTNEYDFTSPVKADITLYAKWEAEPVEE